MTLKQLLLALACVACCSVAPAKDTAETDAGMGQVLANCLNKTYQFEFEQKLCDQALLYSARVNDLHLKAISARLVEYDKLSEQGVSSNVVGNAVIAQQLWMGPVIFLVVVVVVMSGLYFSYLQFRLKTIAVVAPTPAPDAAAPVAALPIVSGAQFKISREGIEFQSPFIGLVVLAISLGFFYLYLVNVYKITTIGSRTDQAGGTAIPPEHRAKAASEPVK